MKKLITFIVFTTLLSGCSADFAQRYADAKRDQERKEHHHHEHQNDDYTSSDGYRIARNCRMRVRQIMVDAAGISKTAIFILRTAISQIHHSLRFQSPVCTT